MLLPTDIHNKETKFTTTYLINNLSGNEYLEHLQHKNKNIHQKKKKHKNKNIDINQNIDSAVL